jgi:hypothetical protein
MGEESWSPWLFAFAGKCRWCKQKAALNTHSRCQPCDEHYKAHFKAVSFYSVRNEKQIGTFSSYRWENSD